VADKETIAFGVQDNIISSVCLAVDWVCFGITNEHGWYLCGCDLALEDGSHAEKDISYRIKINYIPEICACYSGIESNRGIGHCDIELSNITIKLKVKDVFKFTAEQCQCDKKRRPCNKNDSDNSRQKKLKYKE
jgi:hypothetical protein